MFTASTQFSNFKLVNVSKVLVFRKMAHITMVKGIIIIICREATTLLLVHVIKFIKVLLNPLTD